MSTDAYKIEEASTGPEVAEGGLKQNIGAEPAGRKWRDPRPDLPGDIVGHPDRPVSKSCGPLPAAPLPSEADFYNRYTWCLNAFPCLHEVLDHLSEELTRLDEALEAWQLSEVITNIFMLSCSVADTVDDYLLGDVYDFSKIERVTSFATPGAHILEKLLGLAAGLRARRLAPLRRWRKTWGATVTEFLEQCFIIGAPEKAVLFEQRKRLMHLLGRARLPRAARKRRANIPAFFRSRDFGPSDCLELCRKFVAACPGDRRPVLVVGLRTAGSFLAPLSCAFLRKQGYEVDWVAIRPGKGLARWEKSILQVAAQQKGRVLLADESIHSGQTLAKAVELLRCSGFADEDVLVLNPAEPAFPDWNTSRICQALPQVETITLQPEERYKSRLLDSSEVTVRLEEYFKARGYTRTRLAFSPENEQLNYKWRAKSPERVDIRLKRIYEVHLERFDGTSELRYVLAKSVGWGWLSYHAFLAAEKLGEFVPPLLGLRNGILYTEWIPDSSDLSVFVQNRDLLVESVASYVAARAQRLDLGCDPTPDLAGEFRHKGLGMLANSLSRAYGSRVVAALNRLRIPGRLANQGCPTAVMTDSKMSAEEWIVAGHRLLKTDFEHHAQGKNELGMTDPAYDLAGAIFHFGFSESESAHLVRTYVERTGDAHIQDRLLFSKLLVGLWEQNLALLGLQNANLLQRRAEFHQQYTQAWNFLVSEAIRRCGELCRRPTEILWKAPLVVTDIDGVLDRMVFGFPCATGAGIKAISLLHSHGYAIAANTARSLEEVKQYCRSYGFAGGLAEYGAVIWDALHHREIVLVSTQSLQQLEHVRQALRQVPGVFLNDDYRYSLRAFTYQNDRTTPLPGGLIQDLLAESGADRLRVHHTGLDTAIVAKEADKGTGLVALLALVGLSTDQVLAIGDSEPDLAMFRVAHPSFAPAHISCHREARLLGCHIADLPYQPGLLQIAQRICHPEGGACKHCRSVEEAWAGNSSFFTSLLEAADQKPFSLLLRNLLDPALLAIFRK